MPIPDFQSIMLPLVRHLADGAERSTQETLDELARHFGVTDAERAEVLPSGQTPVFTNRVAWAKAHLKAAGLLESPRRGVYRITQRGRDVLKENPPAVNIAFLARYPEYVAFRSSKEKSGDQTPSVLVEPKQPEGRTESTPEEYMEYGYGRIRAALASEIRRRVS